MNKEIEKLFDAWIDEVQKSGLTRFEELAFNLSDQEAIVLESAMQLAFCAGVRQSMKGT